MILRKAFPILNLKFLYNGITPKSNFVCIWRQRICAKNNIGILSTKTFCTDDGIKIPSQGNQNEKNPQISEGARIENPQISEGVRIENPHISIGARIENPQILEGARIENPQILEGARIENPQISEGARIENPHKSIGARIENPQILEGARIENPQISEGARMEVEKWLEMCKFQGMKVPNEISEEHLLELSEFTNEDMRKRFLHFLVKRELARLNSKVVKERKKAVKAKIQEERRNRPIEHLNYGLWRNAMFAKTNKRTILDLYKHKMASVMQFGQPLIVDLGFEEHMKGRELTSYAEQLAMSVSINRLNVDPFNLMFCNADFEAKGFKKFNKAMPNTLKPDYPMIIESKSYLDLFPREKLVYLSPDASETLETFDHDAVYIIGGIVDLGKSPPLTLAKAKKENINTQKLPLDMYHIFKGHKRMGIHVMLKILLDVQKDGNWKRAFTAIPQRLLQTAEGSEHHDRWNKGNKPWQC